MTNPFEQLETRLTSIENLLMQVIAKEQPKKELPETPLTIQCAAAFLKLSVPTLYAKVGRGELPHLKRGKRLYFTYKDLMTYLEQGRKKTVSEIETETDNFLTKLK